MQPKTLLPFLCLALGVSAAPALLKRQEVDDSVPNFINDDGTIDLTNLAAASAITPTIVAPVQASNVVVTVDTAAISKQVVNQEDQLATAADDTPLNSRSFFEKRAASTPHWEGYDVCGPQTAFTSATRDAGAADTPDAFRADVGLAQKARTAPKPNGYSLSYVALNGVYQSTTGNSFLGSQTLTSYSPQTCADYCDTKVKNCLGFNIYFERDPSITLYSPADAPQHPDAPDLSKCNNPPSVVTIACQFYGSGVNAAQATSIGQVRGDYFRTAKAGSNGYSKATYSPPTLSGFSAPATFGGGKIDNQKVVGKIAGVSILTVNPDFNPQYCADVAAKNYKDSYRSFQTWMQYKDGAYIGQGCMVLTAAGYTTDDAHDAGQYGGKTDKVDETKVWYSSQPVYYYESTSPLIANQGCNNAGLQLQNYYIDNLSQSTSGFGGYYTDMDPATNLRLESGSLKRANTAGKSTLPDGYYSQKAFMYTGYFMAPYDGTYTFTASDIDDAFFVWTDDNAKSPTKSNIEHRTSWESLGQNNHQDTYMGESPGPQTGVYTKDFVAGYHAVRFLYAQDSSTISFTLSIVDPRGNTIMQNGVASKNLVTAPCTKPSSAFL